MTKDKWDKFQSISGILLPIAIAFTGYYAANQIKQVELDLEEKQFRERILREDLRLAISVINELSEENGPKKQIAMSVVGQASRQVSQPILTALQKKPGENGAESVATVRLLSGINGSSCQEPTECNSGYCYPGPSNSGMYCLDARLNCAFPDKDGFKYGEERDYENRMYHCYKPSSGEASWRPM